MQHKSKGGMSKRGISTVIASILVLAITVALAAGLLTFGTSFMASQQRMQPPTTDQIKIENVYFTAGTSQVQVTVRNIGTGAANVTDIYVNGYHCTIAPTSQLIQPGQTGTLTATYSSNWVVNQAYTIMAATHNGGENTYTATYS
jgi:flagellin-like protein